ncbi:MAG: transporter [Tepidisphaeraceae bacterium]
MTQKHTQSLVICALVATLAVAAPDAIAASRPAEGIQDNSFFIEEAYNQESGVVQHILNTVWNVHKADGIDEEAFSLVFTQEWPVFSQTHQFSYTIPYSFLNSDGESDNGIEDVLLNYRLQALSETDTQPAVAPRLSMILPTGDEAKGFGSDTVGLQFNLPVSKVVHDRWTVHGNAGFTWLPDVQEHDLTSYNIGGSAIYAIHSDLNLMLECVGSWGAEIDDAGDVERDFAAVLSPGVRYAFNLPNDTQVVVGLGVPIGLTSAAADYGVLFYLSFEHPFGRR